VREDLGYISHVTPTSQIIVLQATVNVVTGERYKIITRETREVLRGGYGETPGPVNSDLRKKARRGEPPITCRPADLLSAAQDRLRAELKGFTDSGEDVLTYALFPHVAMEFLKRRKNGAPGLYDAERLTSSSD